MKPPASPHFAPIDLAQSCNATRDEAGGGGWSAGLFGAQAFRGIPFLTGDPDRSNLIRLTPGGPAVEITLDSRRATYLVVLHAVADAPIEPPQGFGRTGALAKVSDNAGNALGGHVSDYVLVYADGEEAVVPIRRRFEIQQRHIGWSAGAFLAQPATGPRVFSTASEDAVLGRAPATVAGDSETRHRSGRSQHREDLWLYALQNLFPDKPIRAIRLVPAQETSFVYGLSLTGLAQHPLRPGTRQSLLLDLPEGVEMNALGELDCDSRDPAIAVDLGTVISARAALDYDPGNWVTDRPEAQPVRSPRRVVVDYEAHPAARLYIAGPQGTPIACDLAQAPDQVVGYKMLAPADRRVTLNIVDRETGARVPARLHVHGPAGEYLPPLGHQRRASRHFHEDRSADLVNGFNQHAYVDGSCEIDLPLGTVWIEISRGYEVAPIRTTAEITPETRELAFTLDRVLTWRDRGWVSADTHVHFLSPQTALLEGRAEGVNVVNLLAAQWGEMFSNVGDFDGRTTLGARDFGGDGEFLVRVGSENRMPLLGHISLLGYRGPLIQPLSTGGPDESAIGDGLETSMAAWAQRCRDQGGLVVMPHAPNPQAERAADILLGLVDALEIVTFNPRDAQLDPFGLADWYRFLNIGLQLPLVAGSDKMSASAVLGGSRTYVQMGQAAFSYENWMEAVRRGATFITVGPLVEFSVEGQSAGSRIDLPASGGTLDVSWEVQSVSVPVTRVEVIMGGKVVAETVPGDPLACHGSVAVPATHSNWIALRVRGSYRGREGDIAAHSGAVQVIVGDAPVFIPDQAAEILEQIEGAMAYVETLAPVRDRAALLGVLADLTRAHRRLHDRLHRIGAEHRHGPTQHHHQHDDR